MNDYQIRLEKFMAEIYHNRPRFSIHEFMLEASLCKGVPYFQLTPERFQMECSMMLSIQDQMYETKKEGYV